MSTERQKMCDVLRETPRHCLRHLVSQIQPQQLIVLNGPFGTQLHSGNAHLLDPQRGFYYLISLFADIRIESNLPGLVTHLGTLNINSHCGLNTFEVKGGRIKSETVPFKKLINSQLASPKAQRLLPQGLELFFETPPSYAFDLVTGSSGIAQRWQVRAQCVLEQKNQRWHFPAPPPKDGTPFDAPHKKPKFESAGELYWADEIKNKSQTGN